MKLQMALDPLSALLDIGGKVIDRVWPDPAQAAAAKLELFKLQQSGELAQIAGQMDVNKAEAANPNVFVSGWRPFIGWVCGLGFGVQFVFGPLAEWGSALYGHPVKFPPMDTGTMMPLLLGMLGLGGLRTAEKIQGVAAK
jgi:Holin of 3TMs, for gene-transfer release